MATQKAQSTRTNPNLRSAVKWVNGEPLKFIFSLRHAYDDQLTHCNLRLQSSYVLHFFFLKSQFSWQLVLGLWLIDSTLSVCLDWKIVHNCSVFLCKNPWAVSKTFALNFLWIEVLGESICVSIMYFFFFFFTPKTKQVMFFFFSSPTELWSCTRERHCCVAEPDKSLLSSHWVTLLLGSDPGGDSYGVKPAP